MPAGLQVWDTDGVLIIDTTSLIGRLVGTFDAGTATSGSYNFAGLSTGIPFAIPLIQQVSGQYSGTETIPLCTFNGDTVSWTRQAPPLGYTMPGCTIILGIR